MRNPFLLLLFCFLGTAAFAQTQKLPVQGKLFEDNKPVNGNRDFNFSIAALSPSIFNPAACNWAAGIFRNNKAKNNWRGPVTVTLGAA